MAYAEEYEYDGFEGDFAYGDDQYYCEYEEENEEVDNYLVHNGEKVVEKDAKMEETRAVIDDNKKEDNRKSDGIICPHCNIKADIQHDDASGLKVCGRCGVVVDESPNLVSHLEFDATGRKQGKVVHGRISIESSADSKRGRDDEGFNWFLSWDEAEAEQERLLHEAAMRLQAKKRRIR